MTAKPTTCNPDVPHASLMVFVPADYNLQPIMSNLANAVSHAL